MDKKSKEPKVEAVKKISAETICNCSPDEIYRLAETIPKTREECHNLIELIDSLEQKYQILANMTNIDISMFEKPIMMAISHRDNFLSKEQ